MNNLTVGQRVNHPAFGEGTIAEIDDKSVLVDFDNGEEVVIAAHVFADSLVESDSSELPDLGNSEPQPTLEDLKLKFVEIWVRGAAWRLEFGEILFQIKQRCDHGQWGEFLKENDLPRSTADDYIRQYKNHAGITETRQNDTANPEPKPDSEAEPRTAQIAEEQVKRQGRKPTFHPHELRPKLKNLATEDLELYQIARKQNPNRVDVIWLAAFYEVIAPLKAAEAAEDDNDQNVSVEDETTDFHYESSDENTDDVPDFVTSVHYQASDEDLPPIIGGESQAGDECTAS
jgi:hypothetical protein